MYHFFVEPFQIHEDQGRIEILGGDVNHIEHVLRMRQGEELTVSDGYGWEYLCRAEEFLPESVTLRILKKERVSSELPSRITLYQCLPKGDKMELIVQKAVELGASAVVPVASRRCVVKLDAKKAESKRKRWQAISESAAKQSGRAVVPAVGEVTDFASALRAAKETDVRLIPYECADELLADGQTSSMDRTREILRGIERGQSVSVIIGPEGGLEKSEVEAAVEAGFLPVTLGKRILRTETAGLCVLSALMFHLEV
ncbi:MAG: 16S rRNA (uracil(1498)-N(3))-methyltransferase [Eubacteriales bacterium]|nr:16S rRNA (uracil(1498)-N(3))-methyltransferase [Eubacteriales bacterium]